MVFVLFILQNSQNDLRNTSKNNVNKVQLRLISLFIDWIKTLEIKSIYLSIYLLSIYLSTSTKFYYWQTCGKGLFRIFHFPKIVKEELELLKKHFEEPKAVSVKNKQMNNKQKRSCFNKEYSLP